VKNPKVARIKMKSNNSWRIRLAQILLCAVIVIGLVWVHGTNAGNEPVHMVTDWSHRHVIFSAPHHLGQHVHLLSNPRYVQQLVRRNAKGSGNADLWRWQRAPESPELLQGDWSMNMGNGATVGQFMYPAKYSFNAGTANCGNVVLPLQPDFVAYNTTRPGSATQATVIAYDNIYSGCTGTVPQTYWAYNTGANEAVVTSLAISGAGDQVAFVQAITTGQASLVLLKWAAGTGTAGSPANPTSVTAANYRSCTAPCMTTLPLSGGGNSGNSEVFYDFANDTAYVGDKSGQLHKFTNVFKGPTAPAEVVSAGADVWPAVVAAGTTLTSPVFEDGGSTILVAANSVKLYEVDSTIGSGAGGVTASAQLGSNGIDDSPVVDSSTGMVYVYVRGDNFPGVSKSVAVFQFPLGFASGSHGTEAVVSTTNTIPVALYTGDFDNTYYTGTGTSGNLYVCGTIGSGSGLWQIPITGTGAMGTPVQAFGVTTNNTRCSPITEFDNPNGGGAGVARDLLFMSVEGNSVVGAPVNCPAPSGGCLMSVDVTSGLPSATFATRAEAGGTSGIIVDGASTFAGASQIYFTPLAGQRCTTSGSIGGCAIQASQQGLN
jgi:hypothetical protein